MILFQMLPRRIGPILSVRIMHWTTRKCLLTFSYMCPKCSEDSQEDYTVMIYDKYFSCVLFFLILLLPSDHIGLPLV